MDFSQPLISVIVPVYKVAQWLPACVKSLLSQTLSTFELILVDDGSPDECGALCDAFARADPRVQVIHRLNGGLSAARNSGIDAAKGAYLVFVDSDDFVHPDYLKDLYTACCETGADMALCGVEDVTEEGVPLCPAAFTQPEVEGCFTGKDLLVHFFGPSATAYTVAWNKLYKASLWSNLRYPEGQIHEDDAVAHRLYYHCQKVACLNRPLYFYRLRQGSICRTGLSAGSFDGVSAHAAWCRFFVQKQLPHQLLDQALSGCWQRYLSLCAQALQTQPFTWSLACRWHGVQAELRSLLPLMLRCPLLTYTQKLSCYRWATRSLPLPAKNGKKRVALLLPPGLPVPAIKGGAVEGLATLLAAQNQKEQALELTFICQSDGEAAGAGGRYSASLFYSVFPAGPFQKTLHRLRFHANRLLGKPIHWNCYYSQSLPFLKKLNADLLVAEGGDLSAWQQASRALGQERFAAHLHGLTHSTPQLDRIYSHALAISTYVRDQWLATSNMPKQNVPVLYNCIHPAHFAPCPAGAADAIRQKFGFSDTDFVVLFCGRLEPDKGPQKLLKAIALILDTSVKLLIVGGAFFAQQQSTPFTHQLQSQAKALGDRVHFTGFVANDMLPAYYQLAQLTVVPTLVEEAAGLVAVEAMAAGCPVVATQSGGLPEYLAGSGAVLMPRDDRLSKTLAEAILTLKADPALRTEIACRGRERAALFTAERYHSAFLSILEEWGGQP